MHVYQTFYVEWLTKAEQWQIRITSDWQLFLLMTKTVVVDIFVDYQYVVQELRYFKSLICSKDISLLYLFLAQIQRNPLFPNGIDEIKLRTRNTTIYGRCREDLPTNWNAIMSLFVLPFLYTFQSSMCYGLLLIPKKIPITKPGQSLQFGNFG